jgi:hypothetical protein
MMTQREILEQLIAAREYVRENADALRQEYGSDCLAVSGNSVIDYDADKFKLMNRTINQGRIITYGTIDHLAGHPEQLEAMKRLKELIAA